MSRMKSEDAIGAKARPFTGAEYLESLRDGREIYIYGERDAIAAWARMSYGWMGRSPDYKASLMNTLGANHEFYGRFADNAKSWYARAQEHVLFMNHAIVNPPVDRARAADQVKDVFITIQKETDAGIYVSGAKVVATSSALT